ncbi:carboxypeptidase M32 [Halovenus sp. WSH3]|uniref:Metal-dependent carboxypeptidase n=1 Tax=Halovenus carboxidivorans TaxID=2692199 RepID=A0A6B0T8P3_9EURY|nr:carboxypeptidase M32 [Halovenus carboxidivorans]MXR51230.1 carboxypeptidase M32 [Halovenus carboxidivorans]
MASKETTDSEAYEAFLDHVRQYNYVGDAAGVLSWDQQVMMPDEGTPARSKQSSTLSTLEHELLTDDQLAEWLDELDGSVSGERQAVVREIKREHERASEVPEALVEQLSEVSSNAMPVWEEAKAESDFSKFEEPLEELVELRREYAAEIDPDRDPYEVLVEDYEPYLDIETIEEILGELKSELPALIEQVSESDAELADPFDGEYDESDQEALVREALDELGYDWSRGRLDTAPHPFSTGTQFDARVTTRFSPDDPLDAVGSTIHEFGHARYTLGLPDEEYGTPLGESRDMTVHESQSRFWENHVGRTLPFWRYFGSAVEDHLGVDASAREFYEAANEVYEDNLIRVEADELTYHMHIVLRFEIERDLIRGDLEVSEVPQVWNEKMEEYLGVVPEEDRNGCLQDIHWTYGNFGYFPTYSLGSLLAAQIDATIRSEFDDLDGMIERGEFDPIAGWLTEEIHQHGCRYTTPELIERATGEELSASHFLEYAEDKYGDLYGF